MFWTIRIVAPITMKMPERKNISKSPSQLAEDRSATLVRQQPEDEDAERRRAVKTGRLGTPKKRRIRATPNGIRLMPA